MKKMLCIIAGVAIAHSVVAQISGTAEDPSVFSKLVSRTIPGAPRLNKPMLLKNIDGPLKAKGMGWASPMIVDVNNDGLDDLVLGEFGSGIEQGSIAAIGHYLRVYENTGTKTAPAYNKAPYYLRYNPKNNLYATPISINVWCCMAFTPRLVDLDGDGKEDLVAGQYDTGEILLYKKMDKSYDMGKRIPQTGLGVDVSVKSADLPVPNSQADTSSFYYWGYTTTAFVDLDGDGKKDLIVGGDMLRAALNIGTKQSPAFGIRTPLKDAKGNFLGTIDTASIKDKKSLSRYLKNETTGIQMVPYIVDWDNDGVEDLLVADSYIRSGFYLITFFKGVKKGKKLSFLTGVPLFEESGNGEKLFPGSHPNIWVTDWNNDGIKDLIIGTCITTNYGRYDAALSWQYEIDAGTYKKNPAYSSNDERKNLSERMRTAQMWMNDKDKGYTYDEAAKQKRVTPYTYYEGFYGRYGLEGIAHDGYVYVLLGSND